jgi:hypothetical protein
MQAIRLEYDVITQQGGFMTRRFLLLASVGLLTILIPVRFSTLANAGVPADGKEAILKASDITPKLFPDQVFFRGQTAPVQMRNTGGVRFADGLFVLTGLVDNSGYSTAIRAKYQAYLITEVTLEIGGQVLKPGAYGYGFIDGGKFIALDLGANDLFQVSSQRDTEIKRPTPLQILASPIAGSYRLYNGRDFVEFKRAN